MDKERLKTILEAVLMAASAPLSVEALSNIFEENQRPETDELMAALEELIGDCAARSYELKKISSGYRFQVKKDYADFVSRLWEDKPARYSRALLETLALIAYRQPITRGEIEAVRGVSVSSQIIKTLDEREWIKVVGHRDVPGKPALYATTKAFLDYFNLASLDELPSLQDIRDIDAINAELDLRMPADEAANSSADEPSAEDNDGVIGLTVADATDEDTMNHEPPEVASTSADEPSDDTDGVVSLAVTDEAEQESFNNEPSEVENTSADEASDDTDGVVSLAMDDETEGDTDDIVDASQSDSGEEQDERRDSRPARAEH